jgi:hypothetical protein
LETFFIDIPPACALSERTLPEVDNGCNYAMAGKVTRDLRATSREILPPCSPLGTSSAFVARSVIRGRNVRSSAVTTLKDRILPENEHLPGRLEVQLAAFIAHYNYRRRHKSLTNLTRADIHFARGAAIPAERQRIKRNTIRQRRLLRLRWGASLVHHTFPLSQTIRRLPRALRAPYCQLSEKADNRSLSKCPIHAAFRDRYASHETLRSGTIDAAHWPPMSAFTVWCRNYVGLGCQHHLVEGMREYCGGKEGNRAQCVGPDTGEVASQVGHSRKNTTGANLRWPNTDWRNTAVGSW